MKNQKITTAIKLPIDIDQKKLLIDINQLLKKDWIPHFNKEDYKGTWNVLPLYAPDGNPNNIMALNGNEIEYKPTQLLKECPYIDELLQSFKCKLQSVRLLRLCARAKILAHSDYKLGYEDGIFRLHIPIITNDKVDFILDGKRLNMEIGDCWYTNVNYEHSVCNNGNEDRINLVIDAERNDWTDKLFFSVASKESYFPIVEENLSMEVKMKVIAELERLDTDTAKRIISDLKK